MTKNLYDPTLEHDACGVGMVADLTGIATHATVRDALTILENLEHRGATGSDPESGDGAGILLQMPDALVRSVFAAVPSRGDYGLANWMVPPGTDLDSLRGGIVEVLASVGLESLAWREVPRRLLDPGPDVACR